jgi:DNA/RNA endonuclease YhcR with UshA esterase domain
VQESSIQNLTSIKINEFVVDPQVDDEWVELYNTGSENLDLAGSMICDSRNSTSTCKKISGSIGPNKWLFVDLLTRSFLNNGGDSVILKDTVGNIIDRVDYADELIPDEGQSLVRKADGIDFDNDSDWVVSDNLTPGTANIILDDTPVSNSSTPVKKIIVSKEKFVGLKWKIKYDLRLRQYEETFFDASSTLDPRGGRVVYSWNFGDQIIFGANVKYSFVTSGIHAVIVRATSTAGTIDEKKITIMVYPATETVGSGVIFSELLPRAGSEEDEYIQLKNVSDRVVNMSNWKLAYKNDVYEIPTNTILATKDYLTFYQIITGFTLNNTGGDLLLLNQDNVLLDEVEYGKAEEDAAYVLNNGQWNWQMPAASAKVLGVKISTAGKKSSGQFFTKIADARGGQKGDYAKVKGVVAVLPGIFGSQYFYLTDSIAGIQIYQNKKDFPPLEVGDVVQVYGAVSEANGIKRINIKSKDDVDILSIGNVVTSTELNVDEIDESLAGDLVQTQGEMTEIKSNFMYLDNGSGEVVVYFKQGAKIDKTKFKEGENVRVVGILEQTKTGWQIWPRSNADIESLGPSADLLKQQTLSAGNDTKEKYLTATAGGVTTLILGFLLKVRGAFLKRGALALIGLIKKNKA